MFSVVLSKGGLRPCPVCVDSDARELVVAEGFRLVRCSGCELVYVANPPTDQELEELYSFEHGYHTDFLQDEAEIAQRHRLAAEQFGYVASYGPGRVLDVGASAGFFVKHAADQGWEATGVELSDDTAGLARDRFGADVRTGRLEDAGFEPASFDLITMWDLIEHVREPLETVELASELLAPGGHLAMITPNIDGWFPRAGYRARKLIGRWDSVEPPWHLSQFSCKSLGGMVERAGFEVVEVKHLRQPLDYTFAFPSRARTPKAVIYYLLFAPLAVLGPLFRRGDGIVMVARKG